MIEVAQAGQAGKAGLLFDMHRLRARVFKDMMKWDVHVSENGLEVDQFDLPEAVYLLSLDHNKRVVGSWRLLPTSGPTMIRDVWPQYLETLSMPSCTDVWEVSRFSVLPLEEDRRVAAKHTRQITSELFCALIELCVSCGIKEIFSLYGPPIAKVVQRINCLPHSTSEEIAIDGMPCRIGAFRTDESLLEKVRVATDIQHCLLEHVSLPSALINRSYAPMQSSQSFSGKLV